MAVFSGEPFGHEGDTTRERPEFCGNSGEIFRTGQNFPKDIQNSAPRELAGSVL
jgi:hypothetical protein